MARYRVDGQWETIPGQFLPSLQTLNGGLVIDAEFLTNVSFDRRDLLIR